MNTQNSAVHSTPTCPEDEIQRRQLRFWFFIVLTIWSFATIVSPIVVFCLTQNLYSFAGFPLLGLLSYLWHCFAKYYLFPIDERTYELKKLKVERKGKNKKALQKLDQDKPKSTNNPQHEDKK